MKKPNILFIMCDQLRADVLSCVGGAAATPNLDALVSEGVFFTNCMTVSPLCVPARISLMTGTYPHTNGAWDNAQYILSPAANLWPKAIREAGYTSAVFGKLHLHSDRGDMIAYEPIVQGYGFDTVNETSGPHASTKSRTHLSELWKEKGVWESYCLDMATRSTPFVRPTPLPLEDYYDVYVGREGTRFLESYSQERPWFCHVSFGGPHEPWDAPSPYGEMYAPETMPEPIPPTENAAADRPTGLVDHRFNEPKFRCDRETAKELRANYCGSVTLIDELIGDLIAAVKRRGEWENTIVFVTADHGELNGDHGMVKKRNFYRGALNIPLIVRVPEGIPGDRHYCDALVSLLDVGPTLVDYAGGALDYTQFGKSLRPLIENRCNSLREYILSELSGELMLMDKKWKLVTNVDGQVYQLFDLEKDPEERINLAGARAYQETETRLTLALFRKLAETRCLRAGVMQMTAPPLLQTNGCSYDK